MTQNILQAIDDADQTVDDGAPAAMQDARALLDHLSATLDAEAEEGARHADGQSSVMNKVAGEIPSLGDAIARQADQIRRLVEETSRLNGGAPLAEVRDLYGVLNDVVSRMKQDASQVTAKIGLLTQAVAVIGGVTDPDAPGDMAPILHGAKGVAARMASLESLLKEAGSAIVALGQNASGSQNKVRDISAGLVGLNTHAETDRAEVAQLTRRLATTDQSLAQGLARVDTAIETGQDEIARLHQRIVSADQSHAQGLARLDASIETGRNEIARLHQRIASTDRDSGRLLANLDERATALQGGLEQMQQRLDHAENSADLHAGFQEKIEVLDHHIEEARHDTAAELNSLRLLEADRFSALMNKLEALERKNEILSQDTEHMAARLQAAEQKISVMTQRQKALSTWHDRMAHVLLASPELEKD